MTGIEVERNEAFARIWDLAAAHTVDHASRLVALLEALANEWFEPRVSHEDHEGIEIWQALQTSFLDRSKRDAATADQPLGRVRELMDGQSLNTPAADWEEPLKDFMRISGVGCAAHWFPVKVDAEGVVHLPSSAPATSSDWLLVDMLCRWTREHQTIACALDLKGNGGLFGQPEPVDYDESLLYRILPEAPPSMRPRRRQMRDLAQSRRPHKERGQSPLRTRVVARHAMDVENTPLGILILDADGYVQQFEAAAGQSRMRFRDAVRGNMHLDEVRGRYRLYTFIPVGED